MPISETVRSIMDQHVAENRHARRSPEQAGEVDDALSVLGIDKTLPIGEFFAAYDLCAILSGPDIYVELLDLCSPTRQIEAATEFARNVYELHPDFIALSSGEGEGFILYSKRDGSVHDVDISDFDKLRNNELAPAWPSFNALMEWYLS